jgi:hypothetical protein
MKKYMIMVFIIICSSSNLLTAQTDTEKKPSPQWWMKSSLADTIDQLLFHGEGRYSYTKMTGAIEGEMHSGGAKIAIRKNIFTHQTEYVLDKMNLMLKSFGMNYISESHAFSDYLDVDITQLLFSEGGFIWERDNTLMLNNRYTWYIGVGLNSPIVENHFINILVALGRISQDYTIPVDNIDVVKGAYSALYFKQNYKYRLDQRFSFVEQAYLLANLNYSNRYRMSLNLNFNINIIQPVSLVLGYSYKYDKENELLGAIATNTKQSIGIEVSL